MKKYSIDQIETIVREFVAAANEKYDSDSYACGFLSQTIIGLLAEASKSKQEVELRCFEAVAKRLRESI